LDGMMELYENLFDAISRGKYIKTIRNVFKEGQSSKVNKLFDEHNQLMINRLSYINAQVVSHNVSHEQSAYEKLEKDLMARFKKFIYNQYQIIYNWLSSTITNIRSSSSEFYNANALKTYGRHVISSINAILIRDLPGVFDKRFNDFLMDLMEDLGVVETNNKQQTEYNEASLQVQESNVLAPTVKSLELSFDSFLSTIPDEELDVKELTNMYNDYFGKSITAAGFSRLKVIGGHFTKRSAVVKGKRITYYRKA